MLTTPALLRTHPFALASLALSLALALLAAPAAQAQDSSAKDAALPLWEIGAFAGALSTPDYPASNQLNRRAIVLPFLVYRGAVWRADRNGLGARVLHTEASELDLGFAAALPASSDEVELRRGMPDLGTLIEFGPRLKIKLAEPAPDQRLTLELPLRAVLEFNGGVRQVGYALEPKLTWGWNPSADWHLGSAVSLVWGDQQLNQFFYGVSAAYATPTRPAYEAQAGLIAARLTLDASVHINPDLSLFGYARYDRHDNAANRNSPLFAQSQGTTLGLGLAWTLGRSAARAEARP